MQTPLSLSLALHLALMCISSEKEKERRRRGEYIDFFFFFFISYTTRICYKSAPTLGFARGEKRELVLSYALYLRGRERERESKRKKTQTTKKQRSTKYQRGRARIVLASNYIQMYNVVTVWSQKFFGMSNYIFRSF